MPHVPSDNILDWMERNAPLQIDRLDREIMDDFRASPPAFLTVSAKRKPTR